MNIEIYATPTLPAALTDSLNAADSVIFEVLGSLVEWQDEREWTVLVFEGDQWVSSTTLTFREILVGGLPIRMGGIGGVMTLPEQRGKGYAEAAMRKTMEFLGQQVAFGLLVCEPKLVKYYAKFGWQRVDQPIFYQQSDGQTHTFPLEMAVMIYASNGDSWPAGEINVCGLPW